MRVVLAEDQYLLREGLVRLLAAHGVTVAEAVADGDLVMGAIERHAPDLVLLDLRLPPTFSDEGLQIALRARATWPDLPVLLLSQYVEQLYVQELLDSGDGGVGYLLKDRVFDDVQFVSTIHAVRDGGTVLDPEVVRHLMLRKNQQSILDRLTSRETEVLALMAQGHSNALIATKLVVTDKAVAKHINSILAKLDLPPSTTSSRRVSAVLTYLRS